MQVLEIDEIPDKVGEAEIVFEQEKTDPFYRRDQILPRRQNKVIVLPEEDESRFYSLAGGGQFLFTTGREDNRRLFFGGMDESPFLVRLHFSMLENLIDGEEAFFESLKPPKVREWETALEVSASRQGDFFAVPFNQKEWGAFLKNHLGKGSLTMKIGEELVLFGTRHRFSGLVAISTDERLFIGDGVIKAPDHEPLLLNGPHLIDQAVGFVRPQEAD